LSTAVAKILFRHLIVKAFFPPCCVAQSWVECMSFWKNLFANRHCANGKKDVSNMTGQD